MGEFGSGALGSERFDLLFLELLNDVHVNIRSDLFEGAPCGARSCLDGSRIRPTVERALYTPIGAESLGLLRRIWPRGPGVVRSVRASACSRRQSSDLAVIARGQHRGDFAALETLRPGVLRIFQQAVLEALVGMALGGAEHAGHQPHHGFEQHHGGDFAAGQHIVADRDFLETARAR